MKKKKLIIFDIGSHKLEELSIILSPGKHQVYIFIKWSFFKIIRTILQLLKLKFGIIAKINKYFKLVYFYFFELRKYNLQIISIEPNINVAYKAIKQLRKKYPVYYLPIAVLGHDARHNIEIKKLYYYEHSISTSIYDRGRPIDDSKSTVCAGMKFGTLWDQLINESIIYDGDPFMLRMNCEGSELGVISECKEKNLKPLCIIGSLGDVLDSR